LSSPVVIPFLSFSPCTIVGDILPVVLRPLTPATSIFFHLSFFISLSRSYSCGARELPSFFLAGSAPPPMKSISSPKTYTYSPRSPLSHYSPPFLLPPPFLSRGITMRSAPLGKPGVRIREITGSILKSLSFRWLETPFDDCDSPWLFLVSGPFFLLLLFPRRTGRNGFSYSGETARMTFPFFLCESPPPLSANDYFCTARRLPPERRSLGLVM